MRLVPSYLLAPLALLAAACGGGGTSGAEPSAVLEFSGLAVPVGIGPVDLRMADMDCDGLLDIVALCPSDSTISIRRRMIGDVPSHPLYEAARHILLPEEARDFCIADVNLDGRPDLVAIAGDPDFDLVVLYQDPTSASPQFNPKEFSISKSAPWKHVEAGDVNGDGKVDLVLLDESTGDVALLLNDPAAPGDFLVPAVQLPSFGGACSELAVGDLDGDGLLDVMTLTAGDGAFSFLRQSPAGTFRQKLWQPAAFRIAQHFAVGDVDGDGHLDVVISRSIPENGVDYLPLFQDPASPSGFRESPTLHSKDPTKAMRLADVNRDGLLDLVAAEADLTGETSVAVYVGDPASPAHMKKGTVKFFNDAKGFGRGLVVGDVNGDGFPDCVLADSTRDRVNLLLRLGAPPVLPIFLQQSQVDAPAGISWAAVRLGDLNGDGKADLVVGGPEGVTSFFQNSSAPGTFLPGETVPVGVAVTDIQLADVDGDGRLDVAFAGTSAAGDAFGVLWMHHDTPGFDPPTLIPVSSAGGIAVGDLNGDGLPDLICAVRKNEAAMVAIQITKRAFATGFDVPTGGPSVALALADLDCDGRADIAAVNADDTLSVVRHAPGFPPPGPGLFLAPQVLLFAGGVRVAVGDVNGDGKADLVTADSLGVTIAIQGTSDGSTVQWPSVFRSATLNVSASPGGSAQPLLADVDRDGALDIVAGGSDGGGFRLLRNDPDATDGFSSHVYQHNQTDLEFLRVAAGDVNGDSWIDVVTATGPAPGEVGGHLFLWTQIPGPH